MEAVFLTGASGFIAKHIVVNLLNSGYAVRGSVRSLARGDEVRQAVEPHLDDASDLDTRLTFVALDLGKDEGWEGVMDGCSALLHTASPFPIRQPKTDEEIIRPAVDGTIRALRAAQAAGIERVVMTSSAVAVMYGDLPRGRTTYNEGDWSEDFHPTQNAYGRSKTHAERAAWDFVEKEAPSMRLTTINPTLVMGPALDKNYGTSLQVLERMLSASDPMQPNFGLPIVDVRDVAAMHVKALSTPESEGKRILASESFRWMGQMAALLSGTYPERGIKTNVAPDFVLKLLALFDAEAKTLVPQLGVQQKVDNSRAKDVLGIDFIPADEAIKAAADSIVRYGG